MASAVRKKEQFDFDLYSLRHHFLRNLTRITEVHEGSGDDKTPTQETFSADEQLRKQGRKERTGFKGRDPELLKLGWKSPSHHERKDSAKEE